MVHLGQGGAEDLLPQEPRMQRTLQPPVRDEDGHGGLVLLDDGGDERRCSSASSTSKEERRYGTSTPCP